MTKFDAELARMEPPAFATIDKNTPADLVDLLKASGNNAARQYDKYHEIMLIACMLGEHKLHFVHEPGEPKELKVAGRDNLDGALVMVADNEGAMLSGFWDFLVRSQPALIAGWKIGQSWAMLINRAIRYGLPIPGQYKQNLMVRYPSTDRLLDISNIYLQGVTPAIRPAYDLQDALEYWDTKIPARLRFAFPTNDEILQKGSIGDMTLRINMYLDGMRQALQDYEGGFEDEYMPNLRGPVGTPVRGPRPVSGK